MAIIRANVQLVMGILLIVCGASLVLAAEEPPQAEPVGGHTPKAEQPVAEPAWDDPTEGPHIYISEKLKCKPAGLMPTPQPGQRVRTLATTVCRSTRSELNDFLIDYVVQVQSGTIAYPCAAEFCPLLVAPPESEAKCEGADPKDCLRRRKSAVVPCYPIAGLAWDQPYQENGAWCLKIWCEYDTSTYANTLMWRYWDCYSPGP